MTGRTLKDLLFFIRAISSLAALLSPLHSALAVGYTWVYANPRFVGRYGKQRVDKALDYTHMGMLARLPDGSLAAAWQGAPVFWEGSQWQGIYLSRSHDSGRSWTKESEIVAPGPSAPVWAPVLHVQGNRTWLFYAESRPQCWWPGEGGMHWACGGDVKLRVSEDSAATWSSPTLVASFDSEGGIAKMIANKPAVAASGAWLLPFWREMGGHDCTAAPGMHGKAGVLVSENEGKSWNISDVPLAASSPPTWLIEASLSGPGAALKGGSGEFVQLFRTQVGETYISRSADGWLWTDAEPTSLPNPNSKLDAIALPDGRLLAAFNDDPRRRTKLRLAASADGGRLWERLVELESDPEGSFSYPTLQYLPDRKELLVIYSVGYPPGHGPHEHYGSKAVTGHDARAGSARPARGAAAPSPVLAARGNAWGSDAWGLRVAIVNLTDFNQQTAENS